MSIPLPDDCANSRAVTGRSSAISIPALVVFCAVMSGCGDDDDDSSTTGLALTLLEVVPEAFLGNVPCAEATGGLTTYVATLIDLTPATGVADAGSEIQEFVLPSSAPAPCTSSVAFALVVPQHAYAARIEAYDRSDLIQPVKGISTLLDPATLEPAPPRWVTACGRAPREPTLAIAGGTRQVLNCDPLQVMGEEPTEIEVTISAELCAAQEFPVEQFVVRREGAEIGRNTCGGAVLVEDLAPGEFVELEVLALESQSDVPVLGTLCTARALAGIRTMASCGKLESLGALTVDFSSIYDALGLDCSVELAELVLTVQDTEIPPITVTAATCRGVAHVREVPPGSYTLLVQATPQGNPVPEMTECSVQVEPGLSALAACD